MIRALLSVDTPVTDRHIYGVSGPDTPSVAVSCSAVARSSTLSRARGKCDRARTRAAERGRREREGPARSATPSPALSPCGSAGVSRVCTHQQELSGVQFPFIFLPLAHLIFGTFVADADVGHVSRIEILRFDPKK